MTEEPTIPGGSVPLTPGVPLPVRKAVNQKPITPELPPKPPQNLPTQSRTMDFPDAIREVINGKIIKRLSWSVASDYGLLKDGWLTIFTKNKFHVWKINDGDLEGQDWIVVTEAN